MIGVPFCAGRNFLTDSCAEVVFWSPGRNLFEDDDLGVSDGSSKASQGAGNRPPFAPPGPSPANVTVTGAQLMPSFELDDLRESRKSVAVCPVKWNFCDILCGCPRADRLRGS
jgi:hypothetical protein